MTEPAVSVCRNPAFRPDPSRVVTQLFVPGREQAGGHESRASSVVRRILALDDETVSRTLREVMERFGHRHRDLEATFDQHAARIANRLDAAAELTDDRRLLLGATFTHEYSIESAAACNPSMVLHPDQSSLAAGTARYLMSVRSIGEGHRSSIGFRTGTIDTNGRVSIDAAAPCPVIGAVQPAVFQRDLFHAHLRAADQDSESAAFVLDHLPETFNARDLDQRLAALGAQSDTRRDVTATVNRLRSIAERSYRVVFAHDVELSRRVLWPAIAMESHGMEDARFVRFVEPGGDVTYYATYTAYDGTTIRQQVAATEDFVDVRRLLTRRSSGDQQGSRLVPSPDQRAVRRTVAL